MELEGNAYRFNGETAGGAIAKRDPISDSAIVSPLDLVKRKDVDDETNVIENSAELTTPLHHPNQPFLSASFDSRGVV